MRGFRGGIGHIGTSIGALLSGVLSFKHANIPDFFTSWALEAITPFRQHRATYKVKRRPARVHRGWTPNYYGVAGPESREAMRRREQGAHHQQLMSHKPGTVQPRHIFATEET